MEDLFIMNELSVTARKKRKRSIRRLQLELARHYAIPEGADVVGVHPNTLWKAVYAGYLLTFRAGRRRLVSGQQLQDWLNAGGKTSKQGGE